MQISEQSVSLSFLTSLRDEFKEFLLLTHAHEHADGKWDQDNCPRCRLRSALTVLLEDIEPQLDALRRIVETNPDPMKRETFSSLLGIR
jgi:hypothetical protein